MVDILFVFLVQMRGGPEPLMVTGWAQIVSLDPSYRYCALPSFLQVNFSYTRVFEAAGP